MQVPVDTSDAGIRRLFDKGVADKRQRIKQVSTLFDVPCMFLTTSGDVAVQVRDTLGYAPRARRF